MDERSTGLILRTYPLSDTSLIVHWLSPELGRLSTAAKGGRRPKSPFQGKLDLFFLADFSFRRSRRSDLHVLREVSVRNFHEALRGDLGYLQQASYFARLIEQMTEAETPLPELFDLLKGALGGLPARPPQLVTVFAFEMKILGLLGLQPALANSSLTPGSKAILERCLGSDWSGIGPIVLHSSQIREIRGFLGSCLSAHLGKTPAGRAAATEG